MRYGIVAIGSRGDVQPYIALSLGLRSRGHEVLLMAHENFGEFVAGFGIDFLPLHGSVEGLLKTERGLAMLRSGSIFAFARYLREVVKTTQDEVNLDMLKGARESDVLISSLLAVPWIDAIAEKLGKPWAIVQLNLPSSPTRAFPLAALDFLNFGAYNRWTYRLVARFHWLNNKTAVNGFRRTLGLPPLTMPVFEKIVTDRIPNLYCFSPMLCRRPDDWNAETDITGFLFVPEAELSGAGRKPPDADLSEWLAAGPPPIYIGFGSIPIPDPAKFIRILYALLEVTPHRYVFCQGWSLPMDLPSHPRFFHVKEVNHEWLFPKCVAAIIHGGVGTLAAVLKAGIPVIVVSIIADQPWWGKIVAQKKIGVHLPFQKLSVERLISAIDEADDPDIRIAVSAFGESLRKEDGLTKTLDELDRHFADAPPAAD